MTKEELKKLGGIIHQTLKNITLRNITENRLSGNAGEAWRYFDIILADFERYIDVLEPLRLKAGRIRALRSWVKTLRSSLPISPETILDFGIIAELLERACDLIDTKKKPTDMQSIWNALVLEVAQLKPMLATHLRDVRPIEMVCEHHPGLSTGQFLGLGKRVLRISVPRRAQHSLTRKLLERKENLQLLTECLRRVMRESIDIKIAEPTCPHCGKELE